MFAISERNPRATVVVVGDVDAADWPDEDVALEQDETGVTSSADTNANGHIPLRAIQGC